jgi:Protein of unknown function (DUF2934)
MQAVQSGLAPHAFVQVAAYYLWQRRGCPIGTPEIDWFRAEQELTKQEDSSGTPALVAMAATVGSALGSVAGLVTSVGNLVHSERDSRPE